MTDEQLDRLRADLYAEAVKWGEQRHRDPDGIWWAIARLDAGVLAVNERDREAQVEIVARKIGDWMRTHLNLQRAGTGDHGCCEQAQQQTLDQVQYLALANYPYTLAPDIVDALSDNV